MIKIGLTGGIGSGKTTVSKVFEKFGGAVFSSDFSARKIQNENPAAISKIKELFGEDVYKDGVLNRRRVASEVFNDSEKLKKLNAVVHPLVFEDFSAFCAANSGKEFAVLESAILVESGFYKFADFSVLVSAGVSERIKRVMERDGISREKVMERIKNQMPEEEIKKFCEFVIFNNDVKTLDCQVEAVLRGKNLLF
jgi:dephospho-CoA kinase